MGTAGFIDLHCHWVSGIDDGAATPTDGRAMLTGLRRLGFARVIATPHMRPGLFDNSREDLQLAFEREVGRLGRAPELPEVDLSCEHYFDDVVFERILGGQGLPYPGARAILLEFYGSSFPQTLLALLAQISRLGLKPVIAHPERYRALWGKAELLEAVLDGGAAALLDIAALVGKYGSRPQKAARRFLDAGLYQAACSDAHRPQDLQAVEAGMQWVVQRYGEQELKGLLGEGPAEILAGEVA